ncbi:MAG TPA: lyase family protein [Trebonia sp.]|nr:lyase family protein [Trebonia sp.]
MPDQDAAQASVAGSFPRVTLLGGVFDRGDVATGDAAWLQALLDTEAGLARALERASLAPSGAGAAVTRAAVAADLSAGEVAEVARASELTGNPVPGLARMLARRVPGFAAPAVHRGATSQDIMDTAAMLLARRAATVIGRDLMVAARAAARLAGAHRGTLMIGRTLLQQAVPLTFGVVAAGWLAGLDGAVEGLDAVARTRLAVQFGGAAGTLASLGEDGPAVVALLAEELGLAAPPLPWHTERLRVIDVAVAMARVTAALGKIARDVTLLAQTEVGEVAEGSDGTGSAVAGPAGAGSAGTGSAGTGSAVAGPAGPGAGGPRRGGSSAMPNKRNPVASVAILGCSRQVPGLLATLVASAEQEHQRAAGAWHAEWQPFSDTLRLAGSAAAWGADLLGGLSVDPARMAANLAASGGLPLAERVTGLLAGAFGGPAAHDLVAGAAARAAGAGVPLRDVLAAIPEVEQAHVTASQVDAALDPAGYLGAADQFIDAALEAHERLARGRDRAENHHG